MGDARVSEAKVGLGRLDQEKSAVIRQPENMMQTVKMVGPRPVRVQLWCGQYCTVGLPRLTFSLSPAAEQRPWTGPTDRPSGKLGKCVPKRLPHGVDVTISARRTGTRFHFGSTRACAAPCASCCSRASCNVQHRGSSSLARQNCTNPPLVGARRSSRAWSTKSAEAVAGAASRPAAARCAWRGACRASGIIGSSSRRRRPICPTFWRDSSVLRRRMQP